MESELDRKMKIWKNFGKTNKEQQKQNQQEQPKKRRKKSHSTTTTSVNGYSFKNQNKLNQFVKEI